ncbi:MAG: ubiquinol-cytochrome c reductase iron-sulfur subunit [Nitrosomonadales bacterium]|nr:ubiquinol-cytochrome c reductase iron-sulfur subunit [Nitrosomonadales bacterium]
MADSDVLDDDGRRDFLVKVTSVVGGAGAAAACIPFIASMNPSSDVLSKATTEVDLSGIPEGGMHTVAWQGKPVFVLHRTREQIDAMKNSNGGFQPEPDQQRVKQPEWLVVVGVCTHMGCVPNKEGPGWTCHCHGSQYDDSGRVVRGPAPKNLEVPPYRFIAADKLVIGEA